MPITLFTGLPGAGKSTEMAAKILEILERNGRWYKKTGILRTIYTNMYLNKDLEEYWGPLIKHWDNPEELVRLRDCDVFWDEIATHMDNTQYKETPLELKRWLQQHRKFGIEIYGTTQDFAMIDISFRRMTDKVFLLRKLIGNRDKSATKPPIKHYWGIIIKRRIDPQTYKEDQKENKAYGFDFTFITRRKVECFDTDNNPQSEKQT